MLLLASAPVGQLTQWSNCLPAWLKWSHVINIDSMFLCFAPWCFTLAHLRRYICYSSLAYCMSTLHLPHTLCLALTITWVFLQITWPIVTSTALHCTQQELQKSISHKIFLYLIYWKQSELWSLYCNDIADCKVPKKYFVFDLIRNHFLD